MKNNGKAARDCRTIAQILESFNKRRGFPSAEIEAAIDYHFVVCASCGFRLTEDYCLIYTAAPYTEQELLAMPVVNHRLMHLNWLRRRHVGAGWVSSSDDHLVEANVPAFPVQ